MKFGRRRKSADPSGAANPYQGLRHQFLSLDAETVDAPLRGAALEIGMDGASVTIVCIADGTASMYTSTGGGYLGLGAHEAVRQAGSAFLAAVASGMDALAPVTDVPPPLDGEVDVVAVTADGLRVLRCPEAEAQDPGSVAYPLYVAGQWVITQMRLAAEAQGR